MIRSDATAAGPQPFSTFLFTTREETVRRATAAGVAGFIVDWEIRGKERRQRGADTQINHDTVEDLRRVRAATTALVVCRINGFGTWTPREVADAIAAGADEILVPMVRDAATVEAVLRLCADRARVGILVETAAAVACARDLGRLPLSRVYVGLNDLMLDRDSPHLFSAVEDGTVERVRAEFEAPFGFAGLTRPERGAPIPCRLLIGEMARLACQFSFLRRSFHADVPPDEFAAVVPQIVGALADAGRRAPEAVASDRRELLACLKTFPKQVRTAS